MGKRQPHLNPGSLNPTSRQAYQGADTQPSHTRSGFEVFCLAVGRPRTGGRGREEGPGEAAPCGWWLPG